MKKFTTILILITLIVSAFSLGVGANNEDEDIDGDMDEYIKFKYYEEKKNPWLGVGAAWFFPSAGHAYANNWGRGLKFLGAEIVELGIFMYALGDNGFEYNYYTGNYEETNTGNDGIGAIAGLAYFGTRIWEYVDAFNQVEKHNERLKESLGISSKLKIKHNEVVVGLNYSY